MGIDLEFLAWFVGIGIAIWIPAILFKVRIPGRLHFTEIPDETLPKHLFRWFQTMDQHLKPLGFHPIANLKMNTPGQNMTRFYQHAGHSGLCQVAAIQNKNIGAQLVDFQQELTDGRLIWTRNSPINDLLPTRKTAIRKEYPDIKDAKQLYEIHEERIRKEGVGRTERQDKDAILAAMNRHHMEWLSQLTQAECVVPMRNGETFRLTTRMVIRFVVSYFNPLGDYFSVPRFVIALCVGIGVPLFWHEMTGELFAKIVNKVIDPESGARTLPPIAWSILMFVLTSVFAYGGAIVSGVTFGLLFRHKAILWIILTYLAVRTLSSKVGGSIPSEVAGAINIFIAFIAATMVGFVRGRLHLFCGKTDTKSI
ncbi:MAG TPA: hypothetical protein VI895_00860 [Bdellovibrionota bacterium]|nr:hypothetical protein [Bdellovibrionota bacterium]